MFTFEQITELIELVSKRRLAGLEIEKSGFRLRIDGQPTAEATGSGASDLAPPPQASSSALPHRVASPSTLTSAAAATVEAISAAPVGHVIPSPIVGTFYRAPNPEAPAFVEVGSRVSKGQVLCIVEAMKLMNEIESDIDGVIAEIYPQNGQPVEYGEPLFAIRPA